MYTVFFAFSDFLLLNFLRPSHISHLLALLLSQKCIGSTAPRIGEGPGLKTQADKIFFNTFEIWGSPKSILGQTLKFPNLR